MIRNYISINEFTRPNEAIKEVKSVIIHSIGNEYSTLSICKKEIESLKNQDELYFSLHYIIDRNGDILACIPENEISLSCRKIEANYYNISIGCIPCDCKGEFSKKTVSSLAELLINICNRYNLNRYDILRHYDVTGKRCPCFYVDNCIEFERIKDMIN